MTKDFPLVGVIAPNFIYRSFIGPALALGVDLRLLGTEISSIAQKLPGCDFVTVVGADFPVSAVRTLESEGVVFRPSSRLMSEVAQRGSINSSPSENGTTIEILVARSPHAQASVWSPTELVYREGLHRLSIAPAQGASEIILATLQQQALAISEELELIGLGNFQYRLGPQGSELCGIRLGPSQSARWSVDASITNQFEQQLRAILDLPLGDPRMTADFAVSGNFRPSGERNMYRPYLHLMARSPRMKFHQYRDMDAPFGGHVNSTGNNLLDLTEEIWHALDYMDGEIDE